MKAATLRKRIATRLTTKGGALREALDLLGLDYATGNDASRGVLGATI